MTRRTKIWLGVAVVFTIINVAGAVWAGMMGEVPHCLLHVGLTLAGMVWMWWLVARARTTVPDASADSLEQQRLRELQHSVDAIAVEVERIGEAQRFTA